MDAPDDTGMTDALNRIEAALPDDEREAFSLLLTASAAKAVDAGVSDAKAVDGLIASLKFVRHQVAKRRAH